jgi:ABC-type lipoprotein release transport system permease subunit
MVSMIGLTIGTAALIIVLSVFNGFEDVIKSLYHTFNPDLLISVRQGKTFEAASFPIEKIKVFSGVEQVVQVVEEDALFRYNDKQFIGKIRGLSANYQQAGRLDTVVRTGEFVLQTGRADYAVLGMGVAWSLGVNLRDAVHLLSVYVPKRGSPSSFNFSNAFNRDVIRPAGIFSIQQDFDEKYVLVPLRFARKLLNYHDEVTAVEVYLKKGADVDALQAQIIQLVGKKFSVKNRFQQNESLFKIMKSEKTAVFLILIFILVLASFNMIGALSILIVEKVKDIATLKSMGADQKLIRTIFLKQGLLISLISGTAGLLLGFVVLWLQQTYGFVQLGSGNGDFIINAYPVKMQLTDYVYVFVCVQLIGLLASWYPVRFLLKDFDRIKLK